MLQRILPPSRAAAKPSYMRMSSNSLSSVPENTLPSRNSSFNGNLDNDGNNSFSSSKSKKQRQTAKKSSLYNRVLWAILVAVICIAVVNCAHLLQQQGNLPTGINLRVQYGPADSKKSEFFFGKHGRPKNQTTASLKSTLVMADMTASKSRFLHLHSPKKPKIQPQTNFNPVITNDSNEARPTETYNSPKREPPLQKEHNQKVPKRQKKNVKGEQKEKASEEKEIMPSKEKIKDESPLHGLEYYFELSKRSNHDKEPILRLIRDNAGIHYISEWTYQQLPTWTQVISLYGTAPKLVGLDQCATFQADGDLGDKFLAVSGMFNSGTNLLAKILVRNCVLHHRQEKYGSQHRGIRWQVPWGKHTPPKDEEFRLNHVATKSEGVDATQVLPAVAIRDPYRWLQSMCSHSYTSKWPRVFKRKDPRYHCPNLVPTVAEKRMMMEHGLEPIVEGSTIEKETGATPEETSTNGGDSKKSDEDAETEDENTNQEGQEHISDNEQEGELTEEDLGLHYFPVSVKYSNFTRRHRSLVHLWNEWYQEYIDLQNYPHIMTRMEDLLFFPDQTVPAICECAGGKIISAPNPNKSNETLPNIAHIKIIAESAKKKSVKTRPGEEHTGYLDALIRYGNPSTRSRGFTAHDLKYGKHYLDPTLLDLFGYHYLEEDALLPAR